MGTIGKGALGHSVPPKGRAMLSESTQVKGCWVDVIR